MSDKTLDNVNIADVQAKVSDVKVFGNGDAFQLLCKASSKEQGWMKSCKAMQIEAIGCIVQVTTQQGANVAEALVFVPNVVITDDVNGGRKLVALIDLDKSALSETGRTLDELAKILFDAPDSQEVLRHAAKICRGETA